MSRRRRFLPVRGGSVVRSARTVRLAVLVVLLASSAGLAMLTSAEATQTVTIPSQISIHENALRFHGRVTSPNEACEPDRKVTLYRVFSDGSHAALDSTRTEDTGKWRIRIPGSAGISQSHFFAVAHRRSEGTAGTIFVCKRAHSRHIKFH